MAIDPNRKSKDADRKKVAKILGQNLAKIRYDKELTQPKVAEMMGVSVRYYQKLEAGESCASIPFVLELKKKLKVSWDDIFKGA